MCDVTFFFGSYKTFLICKLDLCPVSFNCTPVYPVSDPPLCFLGFFSAFRAPFGFFGGSFLKEMCEGAASVLANLTSGPGLAVEDRGCWVTYDPHPRAVRVSGGEYGRQPLPSLPPPPAQAVKVRQGATVFASAPGGPALLGLCIHVPLGEAPWVWPGTGVGSAPVPVVLVCERHWTGLVGSPAGRTVLLSSYLTAPSPVPLLSLTPHNLGDLFQPCDLDKNNFCTVKTPACMSLLYTPHLASNSCIQLSAWHLSKQHPKL